MTSCDKLSKQSVSIIVQRFSHVDKTHFNRRLRQHQLRLRIFMQCYQQEYDFLNQMGMGSVSIFCTTMADVLSLLARLLTSKNRLFHSFDAPNL